MEERRKLHVYFHIPFLPAFLSAVAVPQMVADRLWQGRGR